MQNTLHVNRPRVRPPLMPREPMPELPERQLSSAARAPHITRPTADSPGNVQETVAGAKLLEMNAFLAKRT